LDEGRYNCLSATVLFNYLAGEIGLDCRTMEMPGHAMSRVVMRDERLDIETTCPNWFQLKADSDRHAAVSKVAGASAASDRVKAREVSAIQMAAMIYYNRGVDFLGEKLFAEAAAANAKAMRLDPENSVARSNLLATLNNWSIDLGNAGKFEEAINTLRRGLAMDPKFTAFSQNYVHVHRQWVDQLCRERRFEEALDILGRAMTEMPNRDGLKRAESDVRQRGAKVEAGK
jgi:tetratricopeptide (TPR) repeat protein